MLEIARRERARASALPPIAFLTVRQAADTAAVSIQCVRGWISRGVLKAARVGSRWRISPDDLARFLEGESNERG